MSIDTHQVSNQPPPLLDYDAATADPMINSVLGERGVDPAAVSGLGTLITGAAVQRWAVEANEQPPRLRTHDRYGHRIDEVEFHPFWHRLMELSVGHGLHAAAWVDDHDHPHLRRAAGFYLVSQAEAGHGCPISMTYSILPALRANPALMQMYGAGLTSRTYDFGLADPQHKRGLIAGMGMTEKQGGSDVRANTTRAVDQGDGPYLITGHKWFCSAPMSDVFLVLAQLDDAGLSCFCVPRVLPGGDHNVFRLQRLKDKLGNRSNASGEVEFADTVGWLVGEPGRGVNAILEMVAMTRLDCVIGSAAGQRAALVQAIHHARHRRAFGELLINQPLMINVLADLALESMASTGLALRLAAAVDDGEVDLLRAALPAAKYWVCKRTPAVVGEALECLGGNGYVEESGMPRLFRESPLNAIWEGSGNVIALDLLRALNRQPAARDAVLDELDQATGHDHGYDEALRRWRRDLDRTSASAARRLAGDLGVLLQAAQLIRFGPDEAGELFCATRFEGDRGQLFGTMAGDVAGSAAKLLDLAFAQ
ncbi:DNA alkylation response protein [Microlunatus elymi]|uniref:DNA alkylation response protein n=1 Tax=Microlunatus elymi TaxID=2596828 RepID=A0A516PVQ5_9ACTN|nr:acyl-CoA dehydrogenase family protein [Microlunatus elymi]QDP95031.1 DNA alkylation response protein [Microlunatus elymi]